MSPGMKSAIRGLAILTFALLVSGLSLAQTLAHRLILKDGSYQSITKYEVKGERVRYFSAERGEWEEVPKSLVDWDATEKYQQGLTTGAAAPEAAELDKELEAERKLAEARTPEVAPGLRLSDEGGVYLFDTFENQPQLVEIQQAGSDLNQHLKKNILRSAVNPLAGARQTIEIPEGHAKVQAHTGMPAVYVNLEVGAGAPGSAAIPGDPPPLPANDRFKIIRVQTKGGKRVAGAVKTTVTGKTTTDERFVATTITTMTGGWAKITPVEPLANGEYAVAEMVGKDSMNLYVWDFGVNPNAPANAFALKPDAAVPTKSDKPSDLQKRDKQ